jgi:Zn-dependent protease with chaperone function
MDFFQHQERAKKSTVLLVFLYGLGLIGLTAALVIPVIAVCANEGTSPDPVFLFLLAGFVPLLVILGSLFKTLQLSAGGGRSVAESLGGRQVSPASTNPAERRLYNVVEEMALAAGVPVPTIYMMDNEPGINAFAAGFSPNAAVIGVNRGTVELLTRDELQGVIAHEFSHILNGDMRMNLRLIGILFGLQLLALIGYYALRIAPYLSDNSRNSKGAGAGIAAGMFLGGLAMMILGYIGVFFSAIIQAAISRQREFLADASAVQFTRNPDGIAGALKKIGCPNVGSSISSPHAAEASHLFFGNVSGFFSLGGLLATHPDLTVRIKRIDSQFDGRFPQRIEPINFFNETKNAKPKAEPFTRDSILGNLGNLNKENVFAAAAALSGLPQAASESARNPLTAQAVFYALLLDDDETIRKRQLDQIAAATSAFLVEETLQHYPQIRSMPEEDKIPLAQRISSSLRSMTAAQYRQFSSVIEALIAADQKMDLFEYTLKAVLLRDLDIYFGLAKQLCVRYTSLAAVKQPIVTVLSFLAYSGHTSMPEVQGAFSSAMQELGLTDSILPAGETTVQRFDQSLRILAETSPALKKCFFSALLTCVWYDGQITPKEKELLRAVSAMLAVPMPTL